MIRALKVLVFAAALVAHVSPAERIVRLRSTVAPQPSAGQVNTVPDVARPLPLTAVRLTGGPLKRAQELDAKYLLDLEPDRMLAFFRQRAGLVPKAQPYGGWDGDGRNLTGHIAGHYLSAVSLMWAATGDARFKERADYIVSELKAVQDKHGDGYLSALAGGRQAFGDLSKGIIKSAAFDLNGQWSPWYTLHKTFGGLRDAYRYVDNRTALDVEVKFAAWAESVLSPLSDAQLQQMLNTEFGGMNEVLADLYADTGDRRWLALSHKFDHRAVLDPLVHGEDRLNGLHGNTQVPKILGSAVRYAYTGDRDDRSAATFFWDRVVGHHTFATGGHGKDEYFREPDQLGRIIDGRTAETCNVYNMLKLTRRLFALEPDVRYAEFHERALFNHILGSMDPADGTTCYMVPVGRAVRREYQDLSRSFTCCVGSGMESHALHGLGIYYESGDRLWVNLYAPSTARWEAAGVSLDMATSFPEGESASLMLTIAARKPFTLALRRPSWAADGFAVRVNGVSVANLPKPGSYVELKRAWKTGDRVQLTLPKALRLDLTPDNKRRTAILWGPLVLAGDLGPEPPRAGRALNADGSALVEAPRPVTTPMLVAAERPIADWLKPVAGKPGTFRTAGVGKDQELELSPFYRLHHRTYAAYWDLFTPPEYDAKLAELAAEGERLRKLDAVTVAFLRPGDGQREKEFNQQGEETSIVRADDRAGRRGTKWFSYDMPLDGGAANVLVVTYQTDNRRIRTFDILVEGQRVASQTLEPNGESRFFDVEYRLPPALVAGKAKATVRFEATNGNEIGAVFGMRTIRANMPP